MEEKLPVLKVYEIDYSFIIKNYLNPEMWSKTWTLFQIIYSSSSLSPISFIPSELVVLMYKMVNYIWAD